MLWTDVYQPKTLSEVVGHDDIRQTLQGFVKTGQLPHILFHGASGVGKGSAVRALIHDMFGAKHESQVLELNASEQRSIKVIRETVCNFAASQQPLLHAVFGRTTSRLKLIVLDEADNLTAEAQFCLRRVIEIYSTTTRFCFICNYIARIIPALRSRCCEFQFRSIPTTLVTDNIERIATSEGVTLGSGAIDAILHVAKGDLRKALGILQTVSIDNDKTTPISAKQVYLGVAMPDPIAVERLLITCLNQPISKRFHTLQRFIYTSRACLPELVASLASIIGSLEPQFAMPLSISLAAVDEHVSRSNGGDIAVLAALAAALNFPD